MVEEGRVLVVDDEQVILSLLKRVLGKEGYEVITISSGGEALDKVKEEPFDAIFIDIMMPGIDGLKTCRTIKEINPDAVIIVMTGYSVEEKIKAALNAGAYGALYKPFDISEVIGILKKALGKGE